MPFADSPGCRIYFRLQGSSEKPLLVLAHALGTDHGLWDPQMAPLLRHFRVLRLDLRGHGASDAPPGDYSIAQLAADVLAAAGEQRFSYCGLSLGGMIGQWLAAHHGDRLDRVVLANTSPRVADPRQFEARRLTVLEQGMTAVEPAAMQRFFTTPASPAAATIRTTLLATNRLGYAGCCAAIRDMDNLPLLPDIRVPTLVIGGDQDQSTPWAGHGDVLATRIPGARVTKIASAHLSNLERPASFTHALLDFLLPEPAAPRIDPPAPAERASANAANFMLDFQELIDRYAWAARWTRPPDGDAGARRLVALALTAALGRSEEFRLEVRAGLSLELDEQDLKDVLMQVAVYAGAPVADQAFQIAQQELRAATV